MPTQRAYPLALTATRAYCAGRERSQGLASALVGGGGVSTQLPPPDSAEGAAAEAEAAEARRAALAELTAGSLSLAELLEQVAAEVPKHQLGHIHVHAALLALPHIGEVRAGKILDEIGVPYSRHLSALGDAQVRWLISAASTERGSAAERLT